MFLEVASDCQPPHGCGNGNVLLAHRSFDLYQTLYSVKSPCSCCRRTQQSYLEKQS